MFGIVLSRESSDEADIEDLVVEAAGSFVV
jgi:hypothetical protein